MTEEEKNRLA